MVSMRSEKPISATPSLQEMSPYVVFEIAPKWILSANAFFRPFEVDKRINASTALCDFCLFVLFVCLSLLFRLSLLFFLNSDASQADAAENHSGKYS